jgi:hypothetical protein
MSPVTDPCRSAKLTSSTATTPPKRQQPAVEQSLDERPLETQPLLDHPNREGGYHTPGPVVSAPDHREREQLDEQREAVLPRADDHGAERVQTSGEPGDDAAGREGKHAIVRGVDADAGSDSIVQAHCSQRAADTRAVQ